MKTVKESDVAEVVRALQSGEVVACSTDTVYGLLADATSEKAVQRVFLIKGREKGKPLPIFVRDIAMAQELTHISKEQEEFLKQVWPGKVTVVLQSKHTLPEELELDGKIALRIPNHPLVVKLLQETSRPLTGTSANISGQPSCSSAQEVIGQFQGSQVQPDILVDADQLAQSKPSKIVDITGVKHTIIRP